ncbi:sorting nexin-27-like [Ciona intestinalis]
MSGNNRKRREDIYKGPRKVTIKKTDTGFGFNVRGQVSEGGQLKSINGVLYAPLQHVSAILENGSAEMAGVRPGDRILEVNGENVEGSTHRQVVELIKAGGNELRMTVISVPAKDAQRLDPDDDFFYDYDDIRKIEIDVPEYEHVEEEGSKFVVYCIHLKGKLVMKRRYSEFLLMYEELMKIFVEFDYPKFPSKKLFQLSEQQLERRRSMLETFIQETFKRRVIQECDVVMDFLKIESFDNEPDNSEPETHDYNADEELGEVTKPKFEKVEKPQTSQSKVNGISEQVKEKSDDIDINLPNQSSVSCKKHLTTEETLKEVVGSLDLPDNLLPFFCLFVRKERNFYCRLRSDESLAKHAKMASSKHKRAHFAVRKWIFNKAQEKALLARNEELLILLYNQAVSDVKENRIQVTSRVASQLAMMSSMNKHSEYLELVNDSPTYGCVIFPHCSCDSRKRGHVIVNISYEAFKLFACTEDGELESQVIEFEWSEMKDWEVRKSTEDEEKISFCFQYQRGEKKARWVKIFTTYEDYMFDCFSRVMTERKWEEELTSNPGKKSPDNPFIKEGITTVQSSNDDDGDL